MNSELVEERLKELISAFKKDLDSKHEQLNCFCKHGVQLEGWLKGELIYFLEKQKKCGRIEGFEREVTPHGYGHGRRKVDIKVELRLESEIFIVWVELKYWLIGEQKGTPYKPKFYFNERGSIGIKPDIEKLILIENDFKFLLILSVKNPKIEDWDEGVKVFNDKFPNYNLKSLTDPNVYEDSYYLGLLSVSNDSVLN